MTKEDKKNAYLYCKFRDEQFALYDEYAKRNGMMMKTLSADVSIQTDGQPDHQESPGRELCNCHGGAGKQAEQDCPDDRCRTCLLRKSRPPHHLGGGHGHVHVYARRTKAAHRFVPDIHKESDQTGQSGNGGCINGTL